MALDDYFPGMVLVGLYPCESLSDVFL